jgi:transporter family-2 protein
VGAVLSAVGGVGLAVQARLNGQLGARLHDGVLAALLSFGGGLIVLAVAVPATARGRRGLRRLPAALRARELRWWQCLGGACGAFLIAAQGVTVATLGVAIFTVAVVGGQVVSGLLVDRAGLGPRGAQPLTVRRGLGATLAVLAVAVAVGDQFGSAGVLGLAVLPLLGGVGAAWQAAVNGRVRMAAGDPFVATLVNFSVGGAVLVLVTGSVLAVGRLPAHWPAAWFLYLGGLLGIVAVATAASAVRMVGVLVVGLCSVAAQLVTALLLDRLLPGGPAGSPVFGVVGTALALVAAGVAAS